jgi:cyclic pyranopterin monophosphate synthase
LIDLYTDGAYHPVSKSGAWAAILVEGEHKSVFSGKADATTSNRMEIAAALEGILRTPKGSEVSVHTDSQYLYVCAARGWQRKANIDLWQQLDAAVNERKVSWIWVERETESQKEAHTLANGLLLNDKNSGQQQAVSEDTSKLTHIDASGRPRMVDVTEKPDTRREAVAGGLVRMAPSTFKRIKEGSIAKGNVLAVARIAGIMAAKQTPVLIPLCHPLLINEVNVELTLNEADNTVIITSTVRCTGKTGVEMEALTATTVAALTIYDMCKAIDHGMKIENIRLIRKSGGKSGTLILE